MAISGVGQSYDQNNVTTAINSTQYEQKNYESSSARNKDSVEISQSGRLTAAFDLDEDTANRIETAIQNAEMALHQEKALLLGGRVTLGDPYALASSGGTLNIKDVDRIAHQAARDRINELINEYKRANKKHLPIPPQSPSMPPKASPTSIQRSPD